MLGHIEIKNYFCRGSMYTSHIFSPINCLVFIQPIYGHCLRIQTLQSIFTQNSSLYLKTRILRTWNFYRFRPKCLRIAEPN